MSEIDERGELVVAFDASVEDGGTEIDSLGEVVCAPLAPRELSFAEKADLILANVTVLDDGIEKIWRLDPKIGDTLYQAKTVLRQSRPFVDACGTLCDPPRDFESALAVVAYQRLSKIENLLPVADRLGFDAFRCMAARAR
jgi:hypothetical protein